MFMQYVKALQLIGMVIQKCIISELFLLCLPDFFMYLEGDTVEEDDIRIDLGKLTCDPNWF
jgi:competence protein ComGC